MKSIPTFIIEEHHEAFIVWSYAIQQGLMTPTGNTLFHVDEHSDMGVPRFNKSIHNLNGNLELIRDFTYDELNIGGFIIPAVYQEIFNKVYWIKINPKKLLTAKMFVRSYNKEGKKLMKGYLNNSVDQSTSTDKKQYEYNLLPISDLFDNELKVVLDIDLDYFSSITDPYCENGLAIEITEEEYNKFHNTRYHRLRFLCQRIEAIKKENKFFYLINNYEETYPDKSIASEMEILERMDELIKKLDDNDIEPQIITMCTSRYSGFTPDYQVEFIKKNLIKYLQKIYNIEIYKNI